MTKDNHNQMQVRTVRRCPRSFHPSLLLPPSFLPRIDQITGQDGARCSCPKPALQLGKSMFPRAEGTGSTAFSVFILPEKGAKN